MTEPVHYQVTSRIAIVTIDHPPVNALSDVVRDGVVEAVQRAAADADVEGIVIVGEGKNFSAGADLRVFDTLKTREQALARLERIHQMYCGLEDCPKPLVAAIRGNALGGGLELALACHFRVAESTARLGQPEVSLGLIPGAGGTQRLPRLVGPSLALEMCTDGKPIAATNAAAAGLVDLVVGENVLDEAIAFAREKARAASRRKTRDQTIDEAAIARALREADALTTRLAGKPGPVAPRKALAAVVAGLTTSFERGSAHERELFVGCLLSVESRALRHLFFAERAAARPVGLAAGLAVPVVKTAAVIGAGTMGAGIAMCFASAGIPVLLHDVSDSALERGLATIRKNYESSASKGRITRAQVDACLGLITPVLTYDGLGDVDIVIEAAFENLALKQEIFTSLGHVTKPACMLASNTSTLDIDALAGASGRPSSVVGLHFFSPANVMKLLEIVRGRETSDLTIASALATGTRIGKVPVVVGNCFGFVANRMLAYYMREAYLLIEEGATVEQVDRVITGFGLPVGPFAMQDIAGIDVGARIRQHLAAMGKTRAEGPQSEVPDRLFEMGRYGQKTSAGWYRYEQGSRTPIPDPIVDDIAADAAARRGITRRPSVADDEILARITTALANEGFRVLEEGFAARAADIDVIYCHGFGFPRYRGGPMFYAETIGLATVLQRVREYREAFGDYWQPAALLERLVAEGRSVYDVAPAAV